MCGILAEFSQRKLTETGRFRHALNLMAHRGPDDIGFVSGDGYQLGHRRLSIQDLSRGAVQPMTSEDGKVTIIFNGEVYNFKELRAELERKGYEFKTNSDTEVIIYSYIEKGADCVNDFIGMFSIILVDRRNDEMEALVLRDRLGIKPLFYTNVAGKLIFSSEIKAILHVADTKFDLCREAVSSYLSFRYPIRNNTFFEGINVVRPGSIMRVKSGEIVEDRLFWRLCDHVDPTQYIESESQILTELEDIFSSSVSYRTISDVPIGAYLSGGVDSSLIVAKMSLDNRGEVKTYTIGFNEEGYNEFNYADEVANQYQTRHKEIMLDSADYFQTMNDLIEFKDAPLSVPNEVPLYLMSRELKKDITVVLSGEGADEIFGGYGRIFRSADDFEKEKKATNSDKFTMAYQAKYGERIFDRELDHFYWNYCYVKPELKKEWLNKDKEWDEIEDVLKSEFEIRFDEVENSPYVEKMMYAFETVHLRGLLNRVDTTTMAASVEARVPFVDHRLVELAFRIPPSLKLKWSTKASRQLAKDMISDDISEKLDTPKYILKKYGEQYLSKAVLYRKKMGFPVPLDVWFGGDFADLARSVINDPTNPAFDLFDIEEVNQFIDSKCDSHADALKVWMLLNLFVFCNKYAPHLADPA